MPAAPKRANSECEAVSELRRLARDVPGAMPGGEYRRERGDREYDRRDRHSDGRKRQRGKGQVYQGDGSDQHDGVEGERGSPPVQGLEGPFIFALALWAKSNVPPRPRSTKGSVTARSSGRETLVSTEESSVRTFRLVQSGANEKALPAHSGPPGALGR